MGDEKETAWNNLYLCLHLICEVVKLSGPPFLVCFDYTKYNLSLVPSNADFGFNQALNEFLIWVPNLFF